MVLLRRRANERNRVYVDGIEVGQGENARTKVNVTIPQTQFIRPEVRVVKAEFFPDMDEEDF